MPSLVRFEKVSKIFQTEAVMTTALSDVSLSIEKGAFVAITGPSGCGKSTLLSVLGLLETPTVGNYLFDGIDVGTLSAAGRARLRNRALGFVFQSFNLIGDLTVEQNVELPLVYRGVAPSSRRERAGSLLQRLGLMARRDHYPAQLSGGQQQRVAIARALVGEPTMILADEPTGNLDSGTGAKTLALLQELNAEGATICMVTHDHAIASAAKVQIEMLDGRLASRGP